MSSLLPTLSTLLIKTRDDSTFKRLKRKLCRAPDLDIKSATHKIDIEQILIKKMKNNAGKKMGKWYLHVLHDRQTLLHLLQSSSEPMSNLPSSWDILCFSGEIESYDYNCPQNSMYWCKAKVKSSVNFLINPKSFVKCIGALKKSGARLDDLFANVETFVVTQYAYSEPINENCTNSIEAINNSELISCDSPCENVTFVTVVTDASTKNAASHCVYTFLKSNTSHNTELIVVDGCDFDKSVDLTGDSRIKVVKIKSKEEEVIPLGYSLNIAVKHASYDVIFHLLPNNFYFSQNLHKLIHCLAGRRFDMMLSADTCVYNQDVKTSFLRKAPSIANCIYLKNFWKVNHFIELENDEIKLLHHFTKGRMSCVQCFPSILCSFTHNKSTMTDKDTPLMSLPDLLSNDTQELYETIHNAQ